MQLIKSQGNIVEKIVRDGQGRLVRATFCLYENNGRIKARLLNAVIISDHAVEEKEVFLLPQTSRISKYYKEFLPQRSFVSPYFHTNLLYTFGLKPRAPTK